MFLEISQFDDDNDYIDSAKFGLELEQPLTPKQYRILHTAILEAIKYPDFNSLINQ